jgi:hypothetical protein
MTEKKDKILFWIESFQTHFGIAKSIVEKYDCDLYALIVCSPKQKEFFENQKFIKFKKSWFLRDHIHLKNHVSDKGKLQSFENKFSIRLKKIIYAERFFYKYNKYHKFSDEEIFSIIEQELEFYDQLLDQIKPDYVLIRNPEYQDIQLFNEVCKSKNIPVLILSFTRFSDRWMLSSAVDIPFLLDNSEEKIDLKSFDNLLESGKSYSQIHNIELPRQKSNTLQKIEVLKSFFSVFQSSNINNYRDVGKTPWATFLVRLKLLLNSVTSEKFLNQNSSFAIPPATPFAYFPLHFEPEEVILNRADFFSDQLSVIKNISQSLPIGMNLFVKEHPAMKLVGWRDRDYYKKIIEMPNVTFFHPSVSTESLLQNSSLVITIAGSTGLEAAFYQKPSVVFTPSTYSNLSCVHLVKNLNELPLIIKNCLNSKVDLTELNYLIDKIEKSSFSMDVMGLNTSAAQIFGLGGFIEIGEISENIMQKFLIKHKDDFDTLAIEHIKYFNQPKTNNS